MRNEYSTSAWGDIGKNILSLGNKNNKYIKFLINTLNYRFNKGHLRGNTVRNILMLAFDLQKHCNSLCAIKMKNILQIPQNLNILPITNEPSNYNIIIKNKCSANSNEFKIKGQYKIANFPFQLITNNIINIPNKYSFEILNKKGKNQ